MIWCHLILVVFILIKSEINCVSQEIVKTHRDYTKIIVDGINTYRDNLMCVNPIIGLEYISFKEVLVKKAKYLLNTCDPKVQGITMKTCNYEKNVDYHEIDIVSQFIKQCDNEAIHRSNSNLTWMWDPKIISIGCTFNHCKTEIVFCIVNDVGENTDTDLKFEKLRFGIDDAKQRTDLFTNTCKDRRISITFKSCYLLNSSRLKIIHELNKIRNQLATSGNYTNLKYVEWDYDLEMAAVALSQFEVPDEKLGECFIINKFNHQIDLFYHVQNTTLNDADLIGNLIKNLRHKAIDESQNLSLNVNRTYGWIYDAQLRAIGCTFSKLSNTNGLVLCLFNRDSEKRFNLITGQTFCKDCKCENSRYPKLCSEVRKYQKLQKTFGFTDLDWYFGLWSIVIVYIAIIGIIVFIRSVRNYEYQRFLFN